jgi:hypothetical protein
MTHEERAAQVAKFLRGASSMTEWDAAQFLPLAQELIWRAIVEACNGELERRREAEGAHNRAIRIQAALEDRNARLEGWLEQLDNLLAAPVEDMEPVSLERAKAVLDEFQCEEPTI